jgi:hypothetical protein
MIRLAPMHASCLVKGSTQRRPKMIHLRKITLALPFVFIAACSSNRSSGDTGTAAGSIATDSMAPQTDTNPKPAGTAMDSARSAMPMDTSRRDSTMMDTTKKDSTHHRRARTKAKTKKPY